MAIKLLSAATVAAFNTTITTQAGLGYYLLTDSVGINLSQPTGPVIEGLFSNNTGVPNPGVTLTGYNTRAAADAALATSTAGSACLFTGILPPFGPQWIVISSAASTLPIGGSVENTRTAGTAQSLVNATAANFLSLVLQPGRYLVQMNAAFALNAATTTRLEAGISIVANTLPAAERTSFMNWGTTTLTRNVGTTVPSQMLSVTGGTTTVLGVAQADFSAGTVTVFGGLLALRVG